MRVYNEADIIGQVLGHLHRHGISFVVLDGGSQDGSVEIAQSYEDRGLLEHRIVTRDFERLDRDLDDLIEMARAYAPDWILRNDADEFLEPPRPSEKLHDAIAREGECGFNVIQFNNFEFCLTEKDRDSNEIDVRKKLRFYTWSDDFRYKAWRYYLGTTDRESGGHYPVFPGEVKAKVSPRKLVMRHYRFRSPEQALRRVFKERLPRFAPELRARGWSFHYDHFREERQFFVRNSSLLSKYEENSEWNLTKKFEWYPNWRYPTCQELFGS